MDPLKGQRTYYHKKEKVSPKWILIDAKGQILGRLASYIAYRLQGKHYPYYQPNVPMGDFIVVVNAKDIVVTGRKEENKEYIWHSGYPGGLKRRTYKEMKEKDPTRILYLAVKRMLPKNRLGRKLLTRLKIYPNEEHPHEAQKPEKITLPKLK